MKAEELSWKIFTNGAVGLLDNIKAFEQAVEQRTREAIRDGLLAYRNKKGPVNWIPVPDAIKIAMTTEIK